MFSRAAYEVVYQVVKDGSASLENFSKHTILRQESYALPQHQM